MYCKLYLIAQQHGIEHVYNWVPTVILKWVFFGGGGGLECHLLCALPKFFTLSQPRKPDKEFGKKNKKKLFFPLAIKREFFLTKHPEISLKLILLNTIWLVEGVAIELISEKKKKKFKICPGIQAHSVLIKVQRLWVTTCEQLTKD